MDPNTNVSPFDVTGARNDTVNLVAPRTLEGPIRITTEGGYAQIAGPVFPAQPIVQFTALSGSAGAGVPANAAQASANTGGSIVLTGQGFTNSTLVQFAGLDDSGTLGTLTRTGTASNNGTTLSVVVPALARSGAVTVLGSGASFDLQVVPTLRALGGTVAVGNTLVLEGTGLVESQLQVRVDNIGVGSFNVRSVIDGSGSSRDQQLLTLTVPGGVGAGVITVTTAGGSATFRAGATIVALADLAPAADVGGTLATALNSGLAANRSIRVDGGIDGAQAGLDVDLVRLDLNVGDQITLNMTNAASLYAFVRIFDAAGNAVFGPSQTNPGANTLQRWVAPSSGSFYIGISGYNNITYNPNVAGSGHRRRLQRQLHAQPRAACRGLQPPERPERRGPDQRHARQQRLGLGQHRPDRRLWAAACSARTRWYSPRWTPTATCRTAAASPPPAWRPTARA